MGTLARWVSADGSMFGYYTPDQRLVLVDCATRKPVATSGSPRVFRPGARLRDFNVHLPAGHRLPPRTSGDIRAQHDRGEVGGPGIHHLGPRRARAPPVPANDRVHPVGADDRRAHVHSLPEVEAGGTVRDRDRASCATSSRSRPVSRSHWPHPADLEPWTYFSPDGKLFATPVSGTVLVWDVDKLRKNKRCPRRRPRRKPNRCGRSSATRTRPRPNRRCALIAAPEPALAVLTERLKPAKVAVREFDRENAVPSCLREIRGAGGARTDRHPGSEETRRERRGRSR